MFGTILVLVILTVGVFVATNLVVIKKGEAKIVSASVAQAQDADCILVLGASVYADGTPSTILRDRLDIAIKLYQANVAPKIIMSGDNGTESYNEVLAMKSYAVEQGVPSEDVFCDHAGFSTYESMYRAQKVFGVSRMVVVTQTYHLYRALYTGNALGMDVVGVASDLRNYQNQTIYDIRELFARTKDFFKTTLRVQATYSTGYIDLDQSGDCDREIGDTPMSSFYSQNSCILAWASQLVEPKTFVPSMTICAILTP